MSLKGVSDYVKFLKSEVSERCDNGEALKMTRTWGGSLNVTRG